jgi:hypothetical protein
MARVRWRVVLVVAVACAALATTATVYAATRHHGTTCRDSVTYGNRFAHCNTANVVPVADTQAPESTIAPTNVNGTTNGQTYGTAPVDPVGEGLSANEALAKSPDYISVSSNGAVVGYIHEEGRHVPHLSRSVPQRVRAGSRDDRWLPM